MITFSIIINQISHYHHFPKYRLLMGFLEELILNILLDSQISFEVTKLVKLKKNIIS